ncbi:MAG: hypothetical protein GEU99_24315 [Luteitalea sp.]|nr:hypothetical protein [Luteitalea sp.]
MKRFISLGAAAIMAGLQLVATPATEVLTVSVGSQPLAVDAPVEVGVREAVPRGEALEAVVTEGREQHILLQDAPALLTSPDGVELRRSLCAVLPHGTTSGRHPLRSLASAARPAFSFAPLEGDRLKLLEGDRPVLVYNHGFQLAPGAPEEVRRSTYVHPIYDLDGREVSDDFAPDHYHHRGLSWMWPRVTIRDTQYDLWHIKGLRQVFEKWLGQEAGSVCATLGVKNAWRLADRKVMDEWVWLRVFRAGEHGRAIDVRLTWQALEPVQIRGQVEAGYGGLVLRLANRQGTRLMTPAGLQAKDTNLQPLAWADESGRFDRSGEVSGVAIFQHEGNPGFPAGWTLRGSDKYGFLGVAWPGLEPVTLEPQRALTLRFRVWVHRGDASAGQVEAAYAAFSESPNVTVERADASARRPYLPPW